MKVNGFSISFGALLSIIRPGICSIDDAEEYRNKIRSSAALGSERCSSVIFEQ